VFVRANQVQGWTLIEKAVRRYPRNSFDAVHLVLFHEAEHSVCGRSLDKDGMRWVVKDQPDAYISCKDCCSRVCSNCKRIDMEHGPRQKCLFVPGNFAAIGAKKDVGNSV
jgi:hypothetical protein